MKKIDFVLKENTDRKNYFNLEIYKPKLNVFGHIKYVQMPSDYSMNKHELKKLSEFIDRFIQGQ